MSKYAILQNVDLLVQQDPISAHTPGHKNGAYLPTVLKNLWGDSFAKYDLTEIGNLDNLHYPNGCIAKSQLQVAKIWQAKASYYLVNGTSVGLQVAIMATCHGQPVFVPRHVHRSIYHSLILAQAEPIYIPISLDEQSGLPLGIDPVVLAEYIEQYPHCRQLILVNPTYQGITWQNTQCVHLAKQHQLTIIVDEAHGSHLHFNDQLPPSLLDLGADLVVQSWHKTLPVLTQGSVLHVGQDYQGHPLDKYLSLLQTTSPSYLIMSSLEAGSVYMSQEGRADIAHSLQQLTELEQWMLSLTTIKMINDPSWHQDRFKCYLSCNRLDGEALAQALQRHNIYAEMHDSNGCLLLLPLQLTSQWVNNLKQILTTLDSQCLTLAQRINVPAFYCQAIPKQGLTLAQAFWSETKTIPWSQAQGQMAGEFIIKYPPGIPLVVPGEIIDQPIVDLWLNTGGHLTDKINVIAQREIAGG